MPKSKSGSYQVPKPEQSEINQFDHRISMIKEYKLKLCMGADLHFEEVYDLIEKVKYMRKACRAYNSKFRVTKDIP